MRKKNPIGNIESIPLRCENCRPVVGYGKTKSVKKLFSCGKNRKN